VLIPEQKAEPEDPKQPDELLDSRPRLDSSSCRNSASRPTSPELDFVSQFPSIMARFNIHPKRELPMLLPTPHEFPNSGTAFARSGGGITSRVVERLIAKRCELKKLLKTSPPDSALRMKLQRDSRSGSSVLLRLHRLQKRALWKNAKAHEAIKRRRAGNASRCERIAEADASN